MKFLKYNLATKIRLGTADNSQETLKLFPVEMPYTEANEEIAKKEAYNGDYEIYDDGQPEPETPSTDAVTWDELDAAYQEGYQEGYTEGVNSAYDQ